MNRGNDCLDPGLRVALGLGYSRVRLRPISPLIPRRPRAQLVLGSRQKMRQQA